MVNQRTYGSGLIRDVELLEVLAKQEAGAGGLGVSRIAELAGRDKAQVSRALATLADAGLVTRDDDTKAYRPGWDSSRSRPAPPKLTWRTRVRPFCARSLPGSTRPPTCACCAATRY